MALGSAVMSNLGEAGEDHPEHPGHHIRRAREAAGLSQAELGRRSGLGVRTVRRVEAGEGTPEGRTIAALRRALGLPADGAAPDPIAALRAASTIDFIAETTRRFMEAERVIADLTARLAAAEAALATLQEGEDGPTLPTQDLEWPRRNEPHTGHTGSSRA